jgi:hypothetical protein
MKKQLRHILLLGAILGLFGNTVRAASNPPPVDPDYTPPRAPDGGTGPDTDTNTSSQPPPPEPPPAPDYGSAGGYDDEEHRAWYEC